MNVLKNWLTPLVLSLGLIAGPNSFAGSIVVHENGNVGVGQPSPASALEVKAKHYNDGVALIDNDSGSFRGKLGMNSGHGWLWLWDNSGNETTHISSYGNSFFTGGNLGIGTINPQQNLHIKGTQFAGLRLDATQDTSIEFYSSGNPKWVLQNHNGENLAFVKGGGTVSGDSLIYFNRANKRVGINRTNPSYELDVNGTIRGSNVSPSDARWKTNIQTIENPLEKVTQLRGVTYEWADPSRGVDEQIGVIAQEVEQVFPEAVSTDNEGYKSVAYTTLVGPLIEAVKALKKENEALKKRIEALENE